jgi:hypothetical protein
MTIEKMGVRVSNPDQNINLEGASFAELVLFEHLRTENLRRCVAALGTLNHDGGDELLAEIAAQLQAMANASAGVRQEHMRVAHAQGLRFEIVPARGELH